LEAFIHAGASNETKVNIISIHSDILMLLKKKLKALMVFLAPVWGRGIEGKIAAVRYARENKVPFFGICLGMQMAVIEYSRNVLGMLMLIRPK
jgi:CTP synthase